EKTGRPAAAIDHIARELRADYLVALIYELEQGIAFPASTRPKSTAPEPTVGPMIPIAKEVTASPAALQA
ncbi:MAG: hypothetical protein ACXW28_15280, partial [Thermoanaerobaculia bacterium]